MPVVWKIFSGFSLWCEDRKLIRVGSVWWTTVKLMTETETEPSKKLRLVVVGTKLNTQWGGNLPWVGMIIQKSKVLCWLHCQLHYYQICNCVILFFVIYRQFLFDSDAFCKYVSSSERSIERTLASFSIQGFWEGIFRSYLWIGWKFIDRTLRNNWIHGNTSK